MLSPPTPRKIRPSTALTEDWCRSESTAYSQLRKCLVKIDPKYGRLRPRDRDGMKLRVNIFRAARDEKQRRRVTSRWQDAPTPDSQGMPLMPATLFMTSLLDRSSSFPNSFQDGGFPHQLACYEQPPAASTDLPSSAYPEQAWTAATHELPVSPASDAGTRHPATKSRIREVLKRSKSLSWLADVASIISGLTQRSGSSTSSNRYTAPSPRSSASPYRDSSGSPSPPRSTTRTPTPPIPQTPPETNVRVDNEAILRMCCSKRLTESQSCVHMRLAEALSPPGQDGRVPRRRRSGRPFCASTKEANAVDEQGNALIHVAARWGAPVPILISILRKMRDMSVVNGRGETFLHVLEPTAVWPLTPEAFAELTRYLRYYGFDFRQLDIDERTCLSRLVLRPLFSLDALTAFFSCEGISDTLARFLVTHQARKGDRLIHCVCRKLYEQNTAIPLSFHEDFDFVQQFFAKYSSSSSPSDGDHHRSSSQDSDDMAGQRRRRRAGSQSSDSAMTMTSPPRGGGGGGGAGKKGGKSTTTTTTPSSSWSSSSPSSGAGGGGCGNPWSESTDFATFLHHVLNDSYDANEADPATGRTRLMVLLRKARPGQHSEEKVAKGVEKLLGLGADLERRDKTGNTALHHAVDRGLSTAVRLLCLHHADINCVNTSGETPFVLAKRGIRRTRDLLTDVRMVMRYFVCASILHENGADGTQQPPTPPPQQQQQHPDPGSGSGGLMPALPWSDVSKASARLGVPEHIVAGTAQMEMVPLNPGYHYHA